MMPAGWNKLAERFNALSLRERGILAASLALVMLLSGWQFMVEPAFKKHKMLQSQLDDARAEAKLQDSQRQELQRALENDPNRRMREGIVQLQAEKDAVNAELGDLQARLVSPSAMLALLGHVLQLSPEVRVVSLRNLPVQAVAFAASESMSEPASATGAAVMLVSALTAEPGSELTAAPASAPQQHEPLLFRHDAELVVQGSFHALLGYLQGLEALQAPLIWAALEYKVLNYPDGELRLRVSTLGLYKEWLGG